MKTRFQNHRRAGARDAKIEGRHVTLDGEEFYCISHHDRMRPFFLSIVSDADHWMFISSNGALTAGRRNPDLALFPYYTDDKIHDSAEITGPKTIFIAEAGNKEILWEPFSERGRGLFETQRNIYKNLRGNKLVLEEINHDLGLGFRYSWNSSGLFGWVRKATLLNLASRAVKVRMLDGLQNILPCGIGSQFQLEKSTLVDAYKKNELLPDSGLGLFLLSSIPVDRPEPAESLRATTVWSAGLKRHRVLLSSVQVDKFREGKSLATETDVRAERGAYFVESEFLLPARAARHWMMAANVDQGPSQVAQLRRLLRRPAQLKKNVAADIARGTEELWRIVAAADGLQKTARPMGDARHFNNVLFNVMRGGIFPDGFRIDAADLFAFVRQASRETAERHRGFFSRLGKTILRHQLLTLARRSDDQNLERLCQEYLPLTFSRRHGDPSRPWNRFSIAARAPDGRRVLDYEGNWRDIFQNWEALAVSFPGFVSGMVCKFVNATTSDGYNPYRVTRSGFDWEIHDPNDPWSHIGYWGDHQIIYLLKLLEIFERHEPAALAELLDREIFSFANVPYKIRGFAQLLKNPRETVDFDPALDQLTRQRVMETGSDGKLVWDKKGRVLHVNLAEKLLIPLLAKFSNFIPGAGIWLNTQRPEWNDANNALVGNGVSMVTLYQLRRHLAFCERLFQSLQAGELRLSVETVEWLTAISQGLKQHAADAVTDVKRHKTLEALGQAGETYRNQIYAQGFSGQKIRVEKIKLLEFLKDALEVADQTIRANRRADGLYHAYNLAEFDSPGRIPLRTLPEMLEGQVAVLGANILTPGESLDLLGTLKRSALYRTNQNSYLLYPDRRLPRFVEKNNLSEQTVAGSRLLGQLLSDDDGSLIERDVNGVCHFNPQIKNAGDVQTILAGLATRGYAHLVKRETKLVLELFENQFDHRSFTGRSGTFFGYEGLGCIYWHMVSKLLLAAQESFLRAEGPAAAALADAYREIREGIGDFKTPENYGAFPMDPYSHTPAHTGARQPGLTGQVKEDILCRFGELGVSVEAGKIHFQPRLLRAEEFLQTTGAFDYADVSGVRRKIRLKPGTLAFTCCQTPVVYQISAEPFLDIEFSRGTRRRQESPVLDEALSRAIFERTGRIRQLLVGVKLPVANSKNPKQRSIKNHA